MKTFSISYIVLLSGLLLLLSWGCKKEAPKVIPTLTASDVTNITASSATAGGEVTIDGGADVTTRGVCWSSSNITPTVDDSKTSDGSGLGIFISNITGLSQGTTYNVRAYATNSVGTAYYSQAAFKTLTVPTIVTTSITNIIGTNATSGGNVTSDGGSPVTVRGVCWSTTNSPTTANNKTTDGTGVGTYASSISGLTTNTTYYVRAYATNNGGTGYGNEVNFKTSSVLGSTVSDADGNIYSTVTIGTQEWMASNLKTSKFKDGTSIPLIADNIAWANLTTSGYCWYNNNSAANKDTYGALYNWETVHTGKLCPTGWHVPSDAEWTTLTTFLGGESVAGAKLKETGKSHWISTSTGVTNSTGFTAVPGGFRYDGSAFSGIGYEGDWWSTTENSAIWVWSRYITHDFSEVSRHSYGKQNGFSVRCLRD